MQTRELEGGGWKMLANLLGLQANPPAAQLITDQVAGGVSTPPHPPGPRGAETDVALFARPLAREVSGFGGIAQNAENNPASTGAGGWG